MSSSNANFRSATADLLVLTMILTLTCSASAQNSDPWNAPGAIQAQIAKIEIKDQVEIAAEVPGRLVELSPNQVGGVVEKGQVVVRIDDRLIEAQLQEAKAEAESDVLIKFARINLQHAENELQDKKAKNKASAINGLPFSVFSATEIRRLELDVEKAKAELEKSLDDQKKAILAVNTKKVELSQYTVEAGFGGIVTDLHFKSVGSGVRQGDPIMTIVNLEKVNAVLAISPADYERIQLGDTVLVRQTTRTEADTESGRGSSDSPFKSTTRPGQRKTPASIQSQIPQQEITFVGKVTHFSNTAKTDEQNKIQVIAVIENKLAGPGKYLLREGSFIKAVILPE